MSVMKDLLEDIRKAETLQEIEPLVAALEAGSLILERENEELMAQIKELRGQESRG